MSMDTIKTFFQGQAASGLFWGKKHSPVILLAAGTVGVVGTVVLACRATLKVSDVLDTTESSKRQLNAQLAGKYQTPETTIDKDEYDARLRKLQIKAALIIGKEYLPAVGLGLVSIAALTGSHVILTKRNSALMAAYAGLDKAYREYRGRVKEEFGADIDRKFATGLETVEVTERMADGTVETKKVDKPTGRFGGSPYAVIFDETSRKFSKAPGQNRDTLQMNQSFANDKLKAQGHLTLNEVKDMLDLPRTKAGFAVGWIYDPKNPNHTGDNYVDFGFFTGDSEDVNAFIDGNHYYCTLDFNVDGPIWDKAV